MMPTVGKKAHNLAAISFTASTIAMLAYVNLTDSYYDNGDEYTRTTTTDVANCLDTLTRCYTNIECHFTIPKNPETSGEFRAILRHKMMCRAFNKAMLAYLGAAESFEDAHKNERIPNVAVAQEAHMSTEMLNSMNKMSDRAVAADFVYALEMIVCDCIRGNKNTKLVDILTDTKTALSHLRLLYSQRLGQEPPYNAELVDLMQKEMIL